MHLGSLGDDPGVASECGDTVERSVVQGKVHEHVVWCKAQAEAYVLQVDVRGGCVRAVAVEIERDDDGQDGRSAGPGQDFSQQIGHTLRVVCRRDVVADLYSVGADLECLEVAASAANIRCRDGDCVGVVAALDCDLRQWVGGLLGRDARVLARDYAQKV